MQIIETHKWPFIFQLSDSNVMQNGKHFNYKLVESGKKEETVWNKDIELIDSILFANIFEKPVKGET